MRFFLIMLALIISGCGPGTSVWIYKNGIKNSLKEMCNMDKQCISTVEENIDKCIQASSVIEMLMTIDPKKSESKNVELIKNAIDCFNKAGGATYFTSKGVQADHR